MYRIEVYDPKRIGRDKKTNRPKYNVRVCIYDEVTGDRVVDTARRVVAVDDGEAKQHAEQEAHALLPSAEGVRPKRGAKGTITKAWDAWVESIKRPTTQRRHRSVGDTHVKPDMGEREARKVTPDQWRQYFVRKASGMGDNTSRALRSTVQSFYEWCRTNGVAGVVRNPIDASTAFGKRGTSDDPEDVLERLRNEKEEDSKRHLELDEAQAFLAVYRSAYPQTYRLWLLMSACALRVSEASGIEADAFDFRRPNAVRVAVHQQVPEGHLLPTKTNKKRWVDVPASIVPMVRELIEEAPEVAWGGRTHRFLFPSLGGEERGRKPESAPTVSYAAINHHINRVKELAGIHTANAAHMARHTAVLLATSAPLAATARNFGQTLPQHLKYGAAPKGVVGSAIDAQLAPMLPTGNVFAMKRPRVKRGVKNGASQR